MITFFRRAGLGTKLSLLTGVSVATLFLLFTFLLSHNASQQLEDLAVEDLHNQSTGLVKAELPTYCAVREPWRVSSLASLQLSL